MTTGISSFKTYFSALAIIFISFTLMGCPKKISSVSGSKGLSSEGQPFSQETSPQGTQSERSQGAKLDSSGGEKLIPGGDGSEGSPRDQQALTGSDIPENQGTSGTEDKIASLRESRERDMAISDPAPDFSQNIYFDFDMWSIRSDAKNALSENARWLVANSDTNVQIEGHGDARGTNEYNLALGERRARSTKRYLVNLGVDPSRILFISFGEEKNVCNEQNEHCFQKNRRAHFVVKR